jgi:hypothetical protein
MRYATILVIVSLASSFALGAEDRVPSVHAPKLMTFGNQRSHILVAQQRNKFRIEEPKLELIALIQNRDRPVLSDDEAMSMMLALIDLKSDKFPVREAAFQKLKAAGNSVRSILTLGERSKDEETLHRCRELLRLIDYMDSYEGTIFSKDAGGTTHHTHFNPDTAWAPSE